METNNLSQSDFKNILLQELKKLKIKYSDEMDCYEDDFLGIELMKTFGKLEAIGDFKKIIETIVGNPHSSSKVGFVPILKPNYMAKDGTIKNALEIDGKFYAPKSDL